MFEDSFGPAHLGAVWKLLEQNGFKIQPLSWGRLSGQLPQVFCVWDRSRLLVWNGAPGPVSPAGDLTCHQLFRRGYPCVSACGLLGNPGSFSSGLPMCRALCQVLTMQWWIRIKHTYHVSGILLDLLCTCFSLMTIQWNRASCSPWHMRNSRPRGVQHFTQSHTARTSRTEKLAWVVPDPVLISTLPFSPERWGMLLCFCGCVWILLPRSKRMYLNHSI